MPPASQAHILQRTSKKKTSAQGKQGRFKALVNVVSVSYGCIRKEVDALVKFGGLGTARTHVTEIGKKLA